MIVGYIFGLVTGIVFMGFISAGAYNKGQRDMSSHK